MASTKKPYLGLSGGWLTFWIMVACTTDMMLFGYDQGVFSGVVVTEDFLKVHTLVGPSRTKLLSTITAIYDVGCFLGAILAFTIGEKLGRRKSIILGTTVMVIGTILQASSYSLTQMFIGRVILGIGNGVNTATAPVWQTETAQAKWRGKLLILEMALNVFGYCLVNWINYGLSFHEGSIAWRLPISLQLFFMFILFLTIPWLPESPRWLMAHGHVNEARNVLACIENRPTSDPYIETQYDEIRFSIQYEEENAIGWRDMLRGNKGDGTKTLRRLILGAGTQALQQFQGINIMSYYLPLVLINSVGLSNNLSRLLTACNATSYFFSACFAVALVEKFGRRGMMIMSGLGQFVAFLVITILLRVAETHKVYATVSVAFFFLYHVAFAIGMLGVPWLYPTEINSLPMRTKGAAVATATNWITNFAIVEITPIGIQNLGWRFYIVWTVLNAAFVPIIYYANYPREANRTLEDVDAYYRSNPALIVIKDPDAISTKRPIKYIQHEDEEIMRKTNNITLKLDNSVLSEHMNY
ncbi:uncharacterized protein TRUGW13939_08965, partial [Talaromyces rugulosus]